MALVHITLFMWACQIRADNKVSEQTTKFPKMQTVDLMVVLHVHIFGNSNLRGTKYFYQPYKDQRIIPIYCTSVIISRKFRNDLRLNKYAVQIVPFINERIKGTQIHRNKIIEIFLLYEQVVYGLQVVQTAVFYKIFWGEGKPGLVQLWVQEIYPLIQAFPDLL